MALSGCHSLAEFKDKSGFNIYHGYSASFENIKLIKSLLKNVGLKYEIDSFHKMGAKNIRYDNFNYNAHLLKIRVFKIVVNESGKVTQLVMRDKDSDTYQNITPEIYMTLCRYVNVSTDRIIEQNSMFIPTKSAYQDNIVVNEQGFLIQYKTLSEVPDGSFRVVNTIRVMGYGGGP